MMLPWSWRGRLTSLTRLTRWTAVGHAPVTFLPLTLCLSMIGFSAHASADPMRPLPGQQPAAASGTAAPPDRPAVGAAATKVAPLAAPSVAPLVAIRVDSTGQRQALLGAQWLKIGERFTDASGTLTVLGISEHHIDIQRGQDRRKAYLLPPLLDSAKPATGSTGRSTP